MAKGPARFSDDPFEQAQARLIADEADAIYREARAAKRLGTLVATPFSEVKMRRVRWLWTGRMAAGEITLLAGREGTGKSTISADLAAAVTVGKLPGEDLGRARGVIVVATEDDYGATIAPRLRAAGADMARVFFVASNVDDALSLPDDLPALEAIALAHDVALLVLDPLISRLGELDTHKDSEVRQGLEPLRASCGRVRMSVLGLIHLNKSAQADPLRSLMGSTGFSAVARSVMMAGIDPADESRTNRLLSNPKNNLGPPAPTLAYTVDTRVVGEDDGDIVGSRVVWVGEDSRSAWDIAAEGAAEGKQGKRKSAITWLEDYLEAHGAVDATLTKQRGALELGVSELTIYRAAKELGVEWIKQGDKTSLWSLPD